MTAKKQTKRVKAKRQLIRDSDKYAKTVIELCNALTIDRQTYYNYRTHIDAPTKHVHKGYEIDAWKKFLIEQGVQFNFAKQDLKKELTKRDIILRDIAIREKEKKLISMDDHVRELVQTTAIFVQHLDNLGLKLAAAFPADKAIQKECELIVDEIRHSIANDINKLESKDEKGNSRKIK